jgi:hypothetical protein
VNERPPWLPGWWICALGVGVGGDAAMAWPRGHAWHGGSLDSAQPPSVSSALLAAASSLPSSAHHMFVRTLSAGTHSPPSTLHLPA